MNGEQIAFVALGVVVIIALFIVLVWCICRKKRNRIYKTPSTVAASSYSPAQRQFRDPGYTLHPLTPSFSPPAQRQTRRPSCDLGYGLTPHPPGFVIPPAENQFSDPGASVKAPPPGFVIPTSNPQPYGPYYSSYPWQLWWTDGMLVKWKSGIHFKVN
jgi:hypothetical protein